jgi:hypothetical protein
MDERAIALHKALLFPIASFFSSSAFIRVHLPTSAVQKKAISITN